MLAAESTSSCMPATCTHSGYGRLCQSIAHTITSRSAGNLRACCAACHRESPEAAGSASNNRTGCQATTTRHRIRFRGVALIYHATGCLGGSLGEVVELPERDRLQQIRVQLHLPILIGQVYILAVPSLSRERLQGNIKQLRGMSDMRYRAGPNARQKLCMQHGAYTVPCPCRRQMSDKQKMQARHS